MRLEALNWCKTAVPVGLISGAVGRNATDETVKQINSLVENDVIFRDVRKI